MATILKFGNSLKVLHEDDLKVLKELPVGNYVLKQNPLTSEFYLDGAAPFTVPEIYGNTLDRAKRVLETFQSRPNTTGVLLSGLAGTGKTMLAKAVSIEAASAGYPTILVNEAFSGESFNQFIQCLTQPCVIILDEFEKVFSSEHQERLLTLLDGTYSTKKLFLLTTNSTGRIQEHMMNRPGRLFYHFKYESLSGDVIREFCAKKLDKSLSKEVEGIVRFGELHPNFSFDVLNSIVEELNRYKETLQDVLEVLNVSTNEDIYIYGTTTTSIFDVSIDSSQHSSQFEASARHPGWVRVAFEGSEEVIKEIRKELHELAKIGVLNESANDFLEDEVIDDDDYDDDENPSRFVRAHFYMDPKYLKSFTKKELVFDYGKFQVTAHRTPMRSDLASIAEKHKAF